MARTGSFVVSVGPSEADWNLEHAPWPGDYFDEKNGDPTLKQVLDAIQKAGGPTDPDLLHVEYAGCGSHMVEFTWDET